MSNGIFFAGRILRKIARWGSQQKALRQATEYVSYS